MKNFMSIGLIGISSLFSMLTGSNHSARSLVGTGPEMTPFAHVSHDKRMTVSAKIYSEEESRSFLGDNLISRGVRPVQITIHNNTAHQYSLCADSVKLSHVNPKKVAFKVSKGSLPRGIALKVASLFFWPLMIPSTIDGIVSFSNHKKRQADYLAKSLKEDGEIIAPYSTFHRILFVPEGEIHQRFGVTLIDLETLYPRDFDVQATGMDVEKDG